MNEQTTTITDEDAITVRAWVAEATQAASITSEHITDLQAVFENRLGVEQRSDGTIVLYSSDEQTADQLTKIMYVLCLFREQQVYIKDGTIVTE